MNLSGRERERRKVEVDGRYNFNVRERDDTLNR